MSTPLVLSLFPGIGLSVAGAAFSVAAAMSQANVLWSMGATATHVDDVVDGFVASDDRLPAQLADPPVALKDGLSAEWYGHACPSDAGAASVFVFALLAGVAFLPPPSVLSAGIGVCFAPATVLLIALASAGDVVGGVHRGDLRLVALPVLTLLESDPYCLRGSASSDPRFDGLSVRGVPDRIIRAFRFGGCEWHPTVS